MNQEVTAPVEPQSTEPVANDSPEVAVPENLQPGSEAPPKDEGKAARDAMQRRINRLTAEKYQERAERESIARQLDEYRSKTEQSQPQQIPREIIEREASRIAEERSFADKCNAIANDWKASSKDFDNQFQALTSMAGPLVEDTGKPSALLQAVMTTDAPSKVLAHLAANPDVLAGLIDLSPIQQARKLALIESSMSTPTPRPSAAPRPLEPVRGAAAPSVPDPQTQPAAWREWRNKNAKR